MSQQNKYSARYCASKILLSLYKSGNPVKPIFEKAIQQYRIPPKDRSLTMQLVYGVLRQRQTLDRQLSLLSRTPIKKLDPFVHQALTVGLYQIFFLDRIPESAAVNEAVNSCKAAKVHKRLHGFVNGVLRQAIRSRSDLQQKAHIEKDGKPIVNHPDWMVQRWNQQFGKEATRTFCVSNSEEPVLSLRVNTARIDPGDLIKLQKEDGTQAEKGQYAKDAITLPAFSGTIDSLPGYDEGYFQVQDEAAQLATTLLSPFREKGVYLDGCAGLGGKTSHLLQEIIPAGGEVHAVDPEPYRLEKLQENMGRLFDAPPLQVHAASLLDLNSSMLPEFDGILIDAPCSGTGVTGRHPDIRWNRNPEDFKNYQATQLALLNHASSLLKVGGVLVYATCSLESEENSEVVEAFLKDNVNFELSDPKEFLPAAAHKFIRSGYFQPLPSPHIDGFFAARLVRFS